jgi:hypothetical protein
MIQTYLIDSAPLADLWEQPQAAQDEPAPAPAPVATKPAQACLKCGKASPGMFCSKGCKAAWSASMNAFAKRIEKQGEPEGTKPLF